MAKLLEIFISSAYKDEQLLDMLLKALEGPLKLLKQQGVLGLWHERNIAPGVLTSLEIQKHLQAARIILLLISADFMALDFCYSEDMQHLIQRHQAGEICLLPILLRETYWQEAPFGGLRPLPDNGKPVNSWENKDKAFLNIVEGVRKVIDELITSSPTYLGGQISFTPGKQQSFVTRVPNLDENFSLCYSADSDKSTPKKVISPIAHSISLTDGKRYRLEREYVQKQAVWNLYNEKIQRLHEALAIDVEPLTRFKHEKELLQNQIDLQNIVKEIAMIEQLLQ